MNAKFLEEAKNLEKNWMRVGLLKGLVNDNRQQTAILMESVRLRNEFNGTDEEYQEYLKSWPNYKPKYFRRRPCGETGRRA